MLDFPYKLIDLGDGLTLLAVPIKNAPATTVSVFTGVGSRYEKQAQSGIAHIIEHMAFKGTTNRPTREIITDEITALGGETNAATGQEFTYYYVKVPAYHWKQALDIVSDLFINPTYPQDELEKELQVIVQEYMMIEDNPQRKVGKEFGAMIWPDHPLGRGIIGIPETITAVTREDLVTFRDTYYVRNNVLIAIGGDIDVKEAEQEARRLFEKVPRATVPEYEPVGNLAPSEKVISIARQQEAVDLMIGFKGFTREQQHELDILGVMNGIFGSGMHSRLFKHVRDELGLTYYIGAGHMDFVDDGLFVIRAGVAKDKVTLAVQTVLEECKKIADTPVTDHELHLAKEYLKGKMLLDLETTDSILEYYAFQKLLEPTIRTPQEVVEKIDTITKEDVQRVAQEVFRPNNVYGAVLGPVDTTEKTLESLFVL